MIQRFLVKKYLKIEKDTILLLLVHQVELVKQLPLNLQKINAILSFLFQKKNEKQLLNVRDEVMNRGSKVKYSIGDIGVEKTVDDMYEEAISFFTQIKSNDGNIDVLFANAGVGTSGSIEETSVSEFDDVFSTNVRGTFLWIRKVLPYMKKSNNNSFIIVTSSSIVLYPKAELSIYAASKCALQGMIEGLREDLRNTKVKASTLNPSAIATPWYTEVERKSRVMLSTEDVARAARFILEQGPASNIEQIVIKVSPH